jgi:branched-chain amino acid transport system permease protein
MNRDNTTSMEASKQTRQNKLYIYSICIVLGLIVIALPNFTSAYIQSMVIKVLIFGIFAMSLNILWGYTGLFSLGHAAYFGVAGYTVGILTVRYGVENFWITAAAGILMAVLVAAILAIPALRVSGSYFLLVTLALGELLYSVALKWRTMTSGSNGLAGIPLPDLGIPFIPVNDLTFYYLVFIAFIISAFIIYLVIKSPFGHALQGIREDEARMTALGYNIWLYKYIAFILGGLFAGVAGVLFAHYSGIMAPMHLGVITSTLAMLMVIIGSCTTVFGPVLGAAIVILLEHISSIYIPERWPLILGGVFVVAVMFLPGGISVYLLKFWRRVSYGSVKG